MMLITILLFLAAGLAEIGGGYLVWLWLREAKPMRLRNRRGADPHCIRHSSDVSVLPIFRPCIRRLWRSIHRACGPVGMAC